MTALRPAGRGARASFAALALICAAAAPGAAQAQTAQAAEAAEEIAALKRAAAGRIARKWNTSMLERLPNYRSLVVILRFRIDAAGELIGEPSVLSPANPSGAARMAIRQARNALLKAQPIRLPPRAFPRRRAVQQADVTFAPGTGVSF